MSARRPAAGPGSARRARGEASLQVDVAWRGVRPGLASAQVRAAVQAALATARRRLASVSVVFVGDREIARLHREWLADPTVTDVITFDLRGGEDAGCEAEIVVGAERARRVARERGVSPRRELLLYVVHGTLHLSGFDDHSPRERSAMRRAETRTLRALGWPDDPSPHDS